MHSETPEPYNACPFCLTEISDKIPIKVDAVEKKGNESKSKESVNETKKSNPCQFHLGYLSEREQKQQIPEECIVCKDIVDCMLNRMKN